MEVMMIEEIEKIDRSFLTADEVSRALGISVKTFYRNKDKMNFPIVWLGGRIHIPKEPFLEFLRYGNCKKSEE